MEQTPLTEKRQLITALRQSDPHAYGFIVENYFSITYKIAFAFTHDKTATATIVSLVFQRLWDERTSIPDGSCMLAYLCKYIREAIE